MLNFRWISVHSCGTPAVLQCDLSEIVQIHDEAGEENGTVKFPRVP